MQSAPDLFSAKPFWAVRFGSAEVLPRTRAEMEALGWDSCDVIIVTGDAYVDHPSFGMALIGRLLEAQGFRVGILAQPDWRSAEPFRELGQPNLFFGVTAGNMDSLVNQFTSDKKPRSDDAYTPHAAPDQRPGRATIVYTQRCREAFPETPIVIGGIEASLRRIAHYDYWSDKVRRSILLDAAADLLVYGNAERQIVEIAHRLARREPISALTDIRGTAFLARSLREGFSELDSSQVDTPGPLAPPVDPYAMEPAKSEGCSEPQQAPLLTLTRRRVPKLDRARTVLRLPAFEAVRRDPVLYAHASRVLHLESNPGNARALVQRHDQLDLWVNPPPLPLTSAEMDRVYELPYTRQPHPSYGRAKIPAYEMIKFSVTITRGCFGGCSFCSITEHEGRIIQNRSADSVIREIERVRDQTPGFTGQISDLGGPTANMYRLACKSREIEAACRKPSCVFPDVCENLGTDHTPLIQLYRRARAVRGVKKITIGSGVRYDLAVRSPEYVKELVTHHVGGYLKIAPEHVSKGPLQLMMKPGIGTYDRFKTLFDRYSREAGKEQYLIPYFIAAHPGTSDEDMLELALWLKRNGFRADQVQAFLPSPMASATTMYHTGKNPLRKLHREGGDVRTVKSPKQRKLHKAFLRWHDADNWPLLREALQRMGRADLIGGGAAQLIPWKQPLGWKPKEPRHAARKTQPRRGRFLTQHTGLPPRKSS
ncbi:MAG TPA: YgiQ family radical SAM protein [Polyangiales bacterium]|nr:YgiQ family radical SAM protein [Polyangiales bacterium]